MDLTKSAFSQTRYTDSVLASLEPRLFHSKLQKKKKQTKLEGLARLKFTSVRNFLISSVSSSQCWVYCHLAVFSLSTTWSKCKCFCSNSSICRWSLLKLKSIMLFPKYCKQVLTGWPSKFGKLIIVSWSWLRLKSCSIGQRSLTNQNYT